jgi:outer membrane protein TolC
MRHFFLSLLTLAVPVTASASELPEVEKFLAEPPEAKLTIDSPPRCNGFAVSSVNDLQAYALRNNLELSARRSTSLSAQDSKTSSYLALVPSLTLSAGFSRYPESYTSTAQSTKQFTDIGKTNYIFQQSYDFTAYEQASLNVGTTWNILVPGVYTNIRQKSHHYDSTQYDVEALESSIIRQVRTSSLDVISSLESIKSNNQSYITSQEILRGVQSQFDLGFLSQVELLRQKSQVAQFRVQLLNSITRFNNSLNRLNLLINNTTSDCKIYATDTLEVLQGYLPVVSATADELSALALDVRPDLKMIESRISAQHASLDGIKASYLPQTTLSAGYNYSNTNSLNYYSNTYSSNINSESFSNDFTLMLSTSMTFDGGQGIANASALRHDIESLDTQLANARSRIVSNISTYRTDLNYYQQQSEILRDKLGYSNETLNAINIRFNFGYSAITDLLDAQRVLSNTNLELIQNLNREATSIALLLFEISSKP